MKQRSKISEYCEMIRELVGNNTSVISFLKLIQTCDEELTRKINVKNAEIDELKKSDRKKTGRIYAITRHGHGYRIRPHHWKQSTRCLICRRWQS